MIVLIKLVEITATALGRLNKMIAGVYVLIFATIIKLLEVEARLRYKAGRNK